MLLAFYTDTLGPMSYHVENERFRLTVEGIETLVAYKGPVNITGVPHGSGLFETLDGQWNGSTFHGTFFNGRIIGFGKLLKCDGTVYVGELNASYRNGFGMVSTGFFLHIHCF